jgi:hypothetical protein
VKVSSDQASSNAPTVQDHTSPVQRAEYPTIPQEKPSRPMHGSSEKKVPKQQGEKGIGDLLLVNRKEVHLFVIQRHSHRVRQSLLRAQLFSVSVFQLLFK